MQSWKFIQGQMYWGKLICHRWLLTCVSNKLWPEYSPLKTQWPWFALSISSKVKCYTSHKVNWKAIYDLLYVFHTNFDHMMHHLRDTTPWTVCNLDLTFKGNPRSKKPTPSQFENSTRITSEKLHDAIYLGSTSILLINIEKFVKTRLLGHPQPQMYPPVALNQYTLVNRTHKHFIYTLPKKS